MKTFRNYFLFILCLSITACAGKSDAPLGGSDNGFLPGNGAFSGLVALGNKRVAFSGKDKDKYLGKERAGFFNGHGLGSIYTRDYQLDGKNLTLESFQLDNDVGASGIYYYYVGRQLRGGGEEIDVGAQAVLDTAKSGRNLYFYKGRWFFSIIYTDQEPIPDLKPLAQFLATQISGSSQKPAGFEHLNVEGVAAKYARITPGNALNFDIFPPGVYALAPAGGNNARAFVIDCHDKDRAEKTAGDFRRYLQVNCEDFKTTRKDFGKNKIEIHQATDAREGKITFALFDRYLVAISQINEFALGEDLVMKIVNKINASPKSKK